MFTNGTTAQSASENSEEGYSSAAVLHWKLSVILVFSVTAIMPAGAGCLLLRRLRGAVFACGRHNPLQSQIGHHVSIVLIRVRRVE